METTAEKQFDDSEKITLSFLAREALRETNNRADEAVISLIDKLIKDRILLESIVVEAIQVASYSRVQGSIRNDRYQLMKNLNIVNPPALDGAVITNILQRNLLDFPLANGLRLRDATKADVKAQAERYSGQAEDMAHKARWLLAVAKKVPEGSTVGDKLTAEQLKNMFEGARK